MDSSSRLQHNNGQDRKYSLPVCWTQGNTRVVSTFTAKVRPVHPSIGFLDAKLGKVLPRPGEVTTFGMGIARPSLMQGMELCAPKHSGLTGAAQVCERPAA